MSNLADVRAIAWGLLEPDFALSDGRHALWTCHWCGNTIEDKGIFQDDGTRDSEGMAPADFCLACRADNTYH